MSSGRAYTQRFALLTGDGASSSYVVPAGYRAVVRFITGHTGGAPGTSAVLVSAAGVLVFEWRPGPNAQTTFECQFVAYAGEVLGAGIYGPDVSVSVSGYLLTDATGPIGLVEENDWPELDKPSPSSHGT